MSTSASKKKQTANVAPNVVGKWTVSITDGPALGGRNSLQIAYQMVEDDDHDQFFGSICSSGNDFSAYAIQDGEVSINSEVSFSVTMNGVVYSFTGQYDGQSDPPRMQGSFTPPLWGTGQDEGSWTAQAQGGGGEEEHGDHGHSHKPKRRAGR